MTTFPALSLPTFSATALGVVQWRHGYVRWVEEIAVEPQHDLTGQGSNLAALRADSLQLLAIVPGFAGYLWLALLVWPASGLPAPPAAWAGGFSLALGAGLAHMLRHRLQTMAAAALVVGSMAGAACAVLAFADAYLAFLFLLPVVYAYVLLSEWQAAAVGGLAALLAAVTAEAGLGLPWLARATLLPPAIVAIAALACALAARNLNTALDWVWAAYEQAHRHERVAREERAELRRALKALDEATYRLERANYMLGLARDQADEARRLKQQFAQTISHELRTPLNLIVSFTDLMARAPEYYGGSLPRTYARDLGIVHRNARHLQTLINDVLDLARIDAAQMAISTEETSPAALVNEAVAAARGLAESRGLTLSVEVAPGLPSVWVDPGRIRQVLINLLNNAARFTEQGAISVSVRQQGMELVFSVADTGVGIAEEDLPRIFEEFSQVDGSTRRRQGGAGLGLAISRAFVELHGGRIWAESRVGEGSTFSFALPLAPQAALDRAGSERPPSPGLRATQGEKPILLAVTQSSEAAGLLSRYVRGCRTVTVQTLEQARQAVGQLAPQTVVVDSASVPLDADGLLELAQGWDLPGTPFLACPLPGEEPLRQHLAVDGYLIKPVSRQGLWDVLRQLGEDVDKVLVVDDDRDFVSLMERLLDNPIRHYQVISAYNGRDALRMIQRHHPDLLLLDLMLPDIGGVQVLERVRDMPASRLMRIVVVSGQDQLENGAPLPGVMVSAKAAGLRPGEVVQWVQNAVDMSGRAGPVVGERAPAPGLKGGGTS